MVAAPQSPERRTQSGYPKADIAVITALPVEYHAVLACLENPSLIPGTMEAPNTYAWQAGSLRSARHEEPYVVVVGKGDPTTTYGALATKQSIQLFEPRYVVFVGCAGGFPREGQRHGDVAVSRVVFAYEYGKIGEAGFVARNDFTYPVDVGLARNADAASGSKTRWWEPYEEGLTVPTARLGEVASGDKVVDNPNDAFWKAAASAWPKLLAVEMEGAGVAAAIGEAQAEGKVVGFLLVRGISDMPGASACSNQASTTERDNWKPLACANAARFFAELVRSWWPVSPSGTAEVFRDDVQRLRSVTATNVKVVSNLLASTHHVQRDETLAAVELAVARNAAVALTGPSGSGKSAIAREVVERRIADGFAHWVDCRGFNRQDALQYETNLRLAHTLREVAEASPDPAPILALDGLDRVYDDASLRAVAALLQNFSLGVGPRQWRVLLTCQSQDWPRIELALLRVGVAIGWHTLECKPPTLAELSTVWKAIPQLALLPLQERFRPLMQNLKILDLIVARISTGADVPAGGWVGETSVASWFWETEIAAGNEAALRARFVALVAEREASRLGGRPPLSEFAVPDLIPLQGLTADRICRRTAEGTVAFEHDLIGDWVRFESLRESADGLVAFLAPRLEFPLWHRALRLYGVYLLEHQGDRAAWQDTMQRVSASNGVGAGDLLLEALFFSSDSKSALAAVHDLLIANRGALLRRLLNRFLSFATAPDAMTLRLLRLRGLNDERLQAQFRMPSWQYWPAMLEYLAERRQVLVDLAPPEIARLVELWLKHAPKGLPFRAEAAALALSLGRRAVEIRRSYGAEDHDERKLYFRVLLMASTDDLAGVEPLARQAAERIPPRVDEPAAPPPSGVSDRDAAPQSPPQSTPYSVFESLAGDDDEEFDVTDSPDGPFRQVDDDFRAAVLATVAFAAVINASPPLARELSLAVLIRPPARHPSRHDWLDRELGLEPAFRGQLLSIHQGPFLLLLQRDFHEGLELCARLVDHATANLHREYDEEAGWLRVATRRATPPRSADWDDATVHVDLGGTTHGFQGGPLVYGWSAQLGSAPSAATVALIALEKYLYDRMDRKESVEDAIRAILLRVKSVAFLKVLVDLGKRHVELFDGPLLPLLGVLQFYRWDIEVEIHGRNHFYIAAWNQPQEWVEQATAFHDAKHRRNELRLIARHLYLRFESVRESIDRAKERWRALVVTSPGWADLADVMDALLDADPDAYEIEHEEEGTVLVNKKLKARDARLANERRAVEDRLTRMSLPMKAREALEKGVPLDEATLDAYWAELMRIAGLNQGADEHEEFAIKVPAFRASEPPVVDETVVRRRAVGSRRPRLERWLESFKSAAGQLVRQGRELLGIASSRNRAPQPSPTVPMIELRGGTADAVFGGVALLVCLHNEWLQRHPRVRDWCVAALRSAVLSSSDVTRFDHYDVPKPWGWQDFVADAVTECWLRDPHSETWRQLVVRLVFCPRYSTVATVFRRCAQARATEPVIFRQLVRVGLEWAHVRAVVGYVRHVMACAFDAAPYEEEAARFDVEVQEWCTTLCEEFMHDQLLDAVRPWSEIDPTLKMPAMRLWRERAPRREVDLALVKSTLCWVPDPTRSLDVDERREVQIYLREMLLAALASVPAEDRLHSDSSIPDERDRWILERVAVALPTLPSDGAAELWTPVLSLPEHAHYWSESLLAEFYKAMLDGEEPMTALPVARAMFDFAMAGGTKWSWSEDAWLAVVGLDRIAAYHWKERHRGLAKAMLPMFKRWVEERSLYSSHIGYLASWLDQAAGSAVRADLLAALVAAVEKRPTYLDDDRLVEAMASLLNAMWGAELETAGEAVRAAFRRLLGLLVDRQNPVALDLLGRLGRLA